MITNESKKATASMVTTPIMSTVENTIANVIQVGYRSSKEGTKMPFFHLVTIELVDVVQYGRLDTLLVRIVNELAESDQCTEALARRIVGSSALT